MDTASMFPSAAEVAALSGADLDHALVAIERARREVEAAYVAVLDRAEATQRFTADGHAGVRGWASALANTGSAELHRRLQTMRALRDLPHVTDALVGGEIGVDQVREIAQLHANPRTRDLTIDGQTKLLTHARTKAYVEFSEIVGRWAAFGDPHRAARRHLDAHDRRDAIMFEQDGVVHLHAKGGTFQGAALMEIFQRQCDAEFLDDWEHAKSIAGHGDPMALLARTDAQRRFDAIHSLFLGAVSAPPGSVAPEPVVNILMTIDEYESRLDDLATGRHPAPATVDGIDATRCETDTGIPIDPYDAVMASLTGWFRRVVVDAAGVVIDLGRKRRYTGSARVAVILSRRRCLWPGCGRASTRNQIDHTHEHSRGGLTTPDNGGPACGRHNRTKTRGYTVHRDSDGNWHVHRPDGTELTEPNAA
jgi:DNA-binding transcriptional ArsR family regulator